MAVTTQPVFECYASRPWLFAGVESITGWQLKHYRLWYGARTQPDWSRFDAAMPLLASALPQPAVTAERAGLGFVIAHAGRGVDYLVLNWWDNENEWRHRVWLRGLQAESLWQQPEHGESPCVWDLALIHFERETYVDWLLGRKGYSPANYLACVPVPDTRW